jgi:DNA-binding MarR family transcriptional regulator
MAMETTDIIAFLQRARILINEDLALQQLLLLFAVANKEGITHTELAKIYNMSQAAVSRNIGKLALKRFRDPVTNAEVESGYDLVVNKDDIYEPRRFSVYLTDKGKDVIRKLIAEARRTI